MSKATFTLPFTQEGYIATLITEIVTIFTPCFLFKFFSALPLQLVACSLCISLQVFLNSFPFFSINTNMWDRATKSSHLELCQRSAKSKGQGSFYIVILQLCSRCIGLLFPFPAGSKPIKNDTSQMSLKKKLQVLLCLFLK